MPSIGGIKRRVLNLRPRIQSAFVVYVGHGDRPEQLEAVDDFVEVRDLISPHDPVVEQITGSWQRASVKEQLRAGTLDAIVVMKDGRCVGHVWETFANETAYFSGVPRVKLAGDELFMYDLFVEEKFRRGNVGTSVGRYVANKYETPEMRERFKYLYGFIDYENAASILFHHMMGFNIVQTINYLAIGERIKWKIPFSDVPRFGPCHARDATNSGTDLFGTALFPNL